MDVRQEQDGGEVDEDRQRGVGQQGDQHIRPAIGGAEVVQEGDLVDVVAHLAGKENSQSTHEGGQLEGVAEGDQLGEGEDGGGLFRLGQLRLIGGQLGLIGLLRVSASSL